MCFFNSLPGPSIIKPFTAVINSVTQKASVFNKASKKRLTIAKALAYYAKDDTTDVNSFIIQAKELVS
jgi:hypothetical protein